MINAVRNRDSRTLLGGVGTCAGSCRPAEPAAVVEVLALAAGADAAGAAVDCTRGAADGDDGCSAAAAASDACS